MPTCAQECFKIITKWESYAVDGPILPPIPVGRVTRSCQPLSDQEAADWVAKVVAANRYSVEEPSCPQGASVYLTRPHHR